ncbi:MAG: prolipoprotein diacylglyceryl transferase [Dehalococcoidia bacterium]|jgi:phosphatidylglycerol:prolipoprotein diacylglycerol transferase|nr:prolipoprotein diacylglyceryl transferase [Dehalococcoidia bacterium]
MLNIQIPFDPTIIKLGNIIISWHGFFMSLGMLLAVYLCLKLKDRFNYDEDMIFNTAFVAIPSGIIGARLLFVIEYFSYFSANPSKIFALQNGGISVWGGIIGGLLGGFLFALIKRYPLLKGLDLAAFGLIFGQAIGRIGDIINGEHLGSATNYFWGVLYTDEDSPAFLHSLSIGAHHPATAYEFFGDMIILLIMLFILLRVRYYFSGSFFIIYLLLYSIMRFFVTYTRIDSNYLLDTGLRIPQAVSLLVIGLVCFVSIILYFAKRANKLQGFFARLEL